jgi:hypothetical protein
VPWTASREAADARPTWEETDMRNSHWKKLQWIMLGSAVLLQLPGCIDTNLSIISLSSVVTAGGVIYLIFKVLR